MYEDKKNIVTFQQEIKARLYTISISRNVLENSYFR